MADNNQTPESKQQKARNLELLDIASVMGTDQGRRFIHRLLSIAGIYTTSFIPGSESGHTEFREGKRNLGLWVMAETEEATPADFIKMLEEARNVEIT